MKYCYIRGCKGTTGPFFSFPKDKNIGEQWETSIYAYNNQKVYDRPQHCYLCFKHFNNSDYRPSSFVTDRPLLKKDAIPTNFPNDDRSTEILTHTKSEPACEENDGSDYDRMDASGSFEAAYVVVKEELPVMEYEEFDTQSTENVANHNSNSVEKFRYLGDFHDDIEYSPEITKKRIEMFKCQITKYKKRIKYLVLKNLRLQKKLNKFEERELEYVKGKALAAVGKKRKQ